MRPGPSALSRCIAVDPATFAARHWDSAPLLSRAADLPDGFTDLLSAEAVDSLIVEHGLRQPFFRLVRDASAVGGVTRTAVAGNRTIGDLADADAIRAEHADGATIVLQSLHRIWPPVARFCRDLAAELGHPTQCNAYVTPAGNAQGFAYHHDTHDVFVLQVAGRKRWRIHPPVLELPTKNQPRSGDGLVAAGQEPLIDTELLPGDALYLPRGYVHAAATTDVPSIHLTVGVLATTWLDILADLVSSCGPQELALRHALPMAPVEAGTAEPESAAGFRKQAAEWLGGLPADQVEAAIRRRVAKAAPPEPLGPMAQAAAAAAVGAHSGVRPRRGLAWTLEPAGDRVALGVPGKRIELPGVAADLVRRALSGPTTPERLAAADPVCDTDDAVVVVRRLLREGVLAPGA
jgi:hypothetical protein